jgi:hypothetical protein
MSTFGLTVEDKVLVEFENGKVKAIKILQNIVKKKGNVK